MALNQKKVKVYAHRAGNSLAGLEGYRAAGFRTVEGDVMYARDTPVMVHPAGLPRRLPDGNLDYEVEEVRAIVSGQDITMPTLQEILEKVEALDMRLLLEIKLPGTVERIAKMVRPFRDRVVIISFFGDEVDAAMRKGLVHAPLMAYCPTLGLARHMLDEDPEFKMILMDQWYVSAQAVRMLHCQLLKVVAFTVNDRERAQAMAALGVDAVLSDNPVSLSQLEGFKPG